MPLHIHIELREGETLAGVLAAAGLIQSVPFGTGWKPYNELTAAGTLPGQTIPARDIAAPVAETTFGPAPDPVGAGTAEAPKRGRPRKTAETAAPVPEPLYIVRRYGGQPESEHKDAALAAARLIELVREAGDPAALDELMQHNEAMVASLPSEMAETVRVAAEMESEIQAKVGAIEPQPEAPAPANDPAPVHPAWPLDEKQQPLLAITPDKQGARNAILAIATGPSPKYGHPVGLALLEKHGVAKLRDITDDADPKHAAIATDAAALLGLPMEGLL